MEFDRRAAKFDPERIKLNADKSRIKQAKKATLRQRVRTIARGIGAAKTRDKGAPGISVLPARNKQTSAQP